MFTFVGMEYTCPLAEEIEDPGRNIPLGIFLGLTLVSVPVVLFGLAAVRYVPGDQLAAFSPVAQMDAAIAILGDTGKWWMALISIGATLSTLNALIAGIPRILYGMGLTAAAAERLLVPLAVDARARRRDRRRRADADSR